jgi:hypothetical protein
MKTSEPQYDTRTPAHPLVVDPGFDLREEERLSRIAAAAYYKALARGLKLGYEREDWEAAEAELAS